MLTPEMEGRGEGFGKYQGLTVAEILELFDRCVDEPSMRSISVILRVTREQLEARGQLGAFPIYALVAAILTMLGLAGRFILPSNVQELATKMAIGAGCMFAILLFVSIPTRKSRRRNVGQENAIREAATKALDQILQFKPTLKPLTFEQEFTVKILIKKTKGSERLTELFTASSSTN
jgi:hypothetical protein